MGDIASDNAGAAPIDSVLGRLIDLAKIDGVLLTLSATRNHLQKELQSRKDEVSKAQQLFNERNKLYLEKKKSADREEQSIKEEEERLVGRRKAIATFSSYKVQQNAEREIEVSAKAVRAREDTLLKVMQEVENFEKDIKKIEELVQQTKEKFDSFSKEFAEENAQLEDKELHYQTERADRIGLVDPTALSLYERVKSKFPSDPVVPVEKGSCMGCHMQVGPQVILQISRGSSLTQCPGCRRIVYTKPSKDEENS